MDMLIKGILIGAAGVGLAWIGTVGVNKFREDKLKVDKKKELEVLEKIEDDCTGVNERVKMDDEVVFKLTNTKLEDLSELVKEINNNGKIVN